MCAPLSNHSLLPRLGTRLKMREKLSVIIFFIITAKLVYPVLYMRT